MRMYLRPVIVSLALLTLLLGVAYPLAITGLAQALLPFKSNGSVVSNAEGTALGSPLVGQPFSDPAYIWSRPSATGPTPYHALASSGSNLSVNNPALREAIEVRIAALRAANPDATMPIPVDLVTASASGLDPHISPEAAEYQVRRVAKARGMTEDAVRQLITAHTEGRSFGLLGEPRVNVLLLNLALDAALSSKPSP